MPTFAEVAAQYGAKPVTNEETGQDIVDVPVQDRAETLLTDVGVDLEPEEKKPSFADIAAQYGAKELPDQDQLPAAGGLAKLNTVEDGKVKKSQHQQNMDAISKETEVLRKEGVNLRDVVPIDHPNRKELEDDFTERWVEQLNVAREEELSNIVTFDGEVDPNHRLKTLGRRRAEESINRFAATFASAGARIFGDEQTAMNVDQSMNNLAEYNSLLDRHSILGKTAGPLFGQIAASLGASTAAASTGGGLGVASVLAIDSYNKKMLEGKDLPAPEQALHATIGAGIDFTTTLVGGAIASKMGVASGETVVPLFSRAAGKLFTASGATKLATAAAIEGGEEGLQTLLGALEDYRSGTDPDAFNGLLDKVLKATVVGAAVGAFTEGSQKGISKVANTVAKSSESTGNLGLAAQHTKDLLTGWAGKLRKEGTKGRPAVEAAAKEKGYVAAPDGTYISKSSINEELEALSVLESEINTQFEQGGATDLKQQRNERKDDLKGLDDDIKDLKRERAKFKGGLGRTDSDQKVSNLNKRIKILSEHRAKVFEALNQDHADLAAWKTEFATIHKEETDFINSEFDRIARLRELPDAHQNIVDSLTKSEAKDKKADAVKKESTEAGKPAEEAKAEQQEVKTEEELQAAKTTDPKAKTTNHPKKGESRGSDEKIFDAIDEKMNQAQQVFQKDVRKVLDLKNLPGREELSTEHSFQQAFDQKLPEKARQYAGESLETGRIMNSVELAGVQARYVGVLQSISKVSKFLENNPDLNDTQYKAQKALLDDNIAEVDILTESWIASSSETGAALQAQQRVYGVVYGKQQALIQGRRRKGKALTADEIANLSKTSDDVQAAYEARADLQPGTQEFDEADFEVNLKELEHKAAISIMEPKGHFLSFVEVYNAVRMAWTLGGDFIAIGRQGFSSTINHPIISGKNIPAFFKPFFEVKNTLHSPRAAIKAAEFEGFKIERSLREMPNYKVLTKDFGVPKVDKHTAYNEVEQGAFTRMAGSGRVAGALTNVPVMKQFEVGFRTWLNATRVTIANAAYENNKYLLDLPGGKQEMQMIIDHAMNATGHTKTDLGPAGSVLMVAPRWFLSRIQYTGKALKHVPLGIHSKLMGQPNGSRYIAMEYGKTIGGAAILTTLMKHAAEVVYGEENVTYGIDPRAPDAGKLTINGWAMDMTGSNGFVIRTAARLLDGTHELITGKDNDKPDFDFTQTLGGTIANRTSGIVRDLAFSFQNGKPIGQNEKMALSEYIIRNSTFLAWQGMYDSMAEGGLDQAAIIGIMELSGVSAFHIEETVRAHNKRNTRKTRRKPKTRGR